LTPVERTQETKVNALQAIVWKGMGFSDPIISAAFAFAGTSYDVPLYNSLLANYSISGWTGLGNIRIMNLVTNTAQRQPVQDQLVEITPLDPHGAVPEPMSVMVWSLIAISAGVSSIARARASR
jgi:hypothetical protein